MTAPSAIIRPISDIRCSSADGVSEKNEFGFRVCLLESLRISGFDLHVSPSLHDEYVMEKRPDISELKVCEALNRAL